MPDQQRNAPSDATSRRRFLKLSGGAVAASALAGVAVPRVHAAETNTIRLALVGCGPRGTGAVMDAFSSTGGPVQLHAMADIFENRLQSSLNNLKRASPDKVAVDPERCFLGFDAYKKAIDCLGPGDVVLLTTFAVFRPVHFEYAVQKGVNVFMEKSFAVDAPGARRLLKSAEESEKKGLKVAAGFMWRHSKARQEAIQRIHDGAIGDVHTQRIYRVHGPVHTPRRPDNVSELVFQMQHPFCFNWTTGGFFVDWHCHNVDVACWVKNAWPVSAQGFGGRCNPAAGNLFDHYTVEFTFADGAKLLAFSRHMTGCWETYADYAHGSKGSAVIMTDLSQPSPKIYKSQRMVPEEQVWRFEGPDLNPYHREWQVLLDAVRQNQPHNESRRAAEADLAALMGRMATHTGAYLTADQVLKSEVQLMPEVDRMSLDTPAPLQAGADGIYPCPQPGVTKEC